MPITLQSGIREYNGDLSAFTCMRGGLTADIHTLRSLNPETTNRVICCMYRGPYFMMNYLQQDGSMYDTRGLFMTYKHMLEYCNTGIQVNFGGRDLAYTPLKGGFAGRQLNIPTQQNAQTNQTITFTVPELVGRPMANFTNMWVDGIADGITGLTTYHGLVAGSEEGKVLKRVFVEDQNDSSVVALEPSPAWEVAEFLIIALDRSGARVEAACAAIGCYPQGKVGQEIYTFSNNGSSQIQNLTLTFNCQLVESAYINDLATRYVKDFAVFGNSYNYNPGAGDAFFESASTTNDEGVNGNGFIKPNKDAVQSQVGNMPVFKANPQTVRRQRKAETPIAVSDHFKYYTSADGQGTSFTSAYGTPNETDNRTGSTAANGAFAATVSST